MSTSESDQVTSKSQSKKERPDKSYGVTTPPNCPTTTKVHVTLMGSGEGHICVRYRTLLNPQSVEAKIFGTAPTLTGDCQLTEIPGGTTILTKHTSDTELWFSNALLTAKCNAAGDEENWLVIWERITSGMEMTCKRTIVKFCGLCDVRTECDS